MTFYGFGESPSYVAEQAKVGRSDAIFQNVGYDQKQSLKAYPYSSCPRYSRSN